MVNHNETETKESRTDFDPEIDEILGVGRHQDFRYSVNDGKNKGRVKNVDTTWGEFLDRIGEPLIDKKYDLAQYLALDKATQDARKARPGYFVGGHFKGDQRRGCDLIERTMLVYDADALTPAQLESLGNKTSPLCQYTFAVYSSRKHTPEKPRVRIIVLLKKPIGRDHAKFNAVSRILASLIGPDVMAAMDAIDECSFKPNQLMYWPSVCRDAEYVWFVNRGELTDPDTILAEFPADWTDYTQLPRSAKRSAKRPGDGRKPQDPLTKTGWVGAFCRTYPIEEAIEAYELPYDSADRHGGDNPRYTYRDGSGHAGMIVYEDGRFAYSHHNTDPASEQLLNAFDLIRVHRGLDYSGMEDVCKDDPAVCAQYSDDQFGDDPGPEKTNTESNPFDDANKPAFKIPEPYDFTKDPTTIKPREFLYGDCARGKVGATVAPGGTGKSTLNRTESLACATGINFLNEKRGPIGKLNVLILNLEEEVEEIERGIVAARLHYEVTPEQIGGRIRFSGAENPAIVATTMKSGVRIATPLIDDMVKQLKEAGIDVLHVDPFISSHECSENDNNAIDRLVKQAWGRVAREANCHVHLWHHVRKAAQGQTETRVEDARGGSALIDAVRSARVLNRISPLKAHKLGLKHHWFYLRVDSGKSNMSPPNNVAKWVQLVSVHLGQGDNVQVIAPWEYPAEAEGSEGETLSYSQVMKALDAVETGNWRKNIQATAWVGKPIANALGLNPDNPKDRKAIAAIVTRWLASGMLKTVSGVDLEGHDREFVTVGTRPKPDFDDGTHPEA
jgi:hypothetical protein